MTVFTNFDDIIKSGKKYDIIYPDPPYTYRDLALNGNRGAGCKYSTMTLEELKNLNVKSIAKKNSVIFMWVTFPLLVDGTCMFIMKNWGFTPKTCAFNWIKYTSNKKSFLGMGNWTRANSELVILGTRGNPKRINAGVRQIIETMDNEYMPDVIHSIPKKHSQKPLIVKNRITQLCGDLDRIELFGRTISPGWDTFGNDQKLSITPMENYI